MNGSTPHGDVTLTDVRMPFGRMVWVILKLAIASIPALILASLVVTLTATLVAVWVGSSMFGAVSVDPLSPPPTETQQEGGAMPRVEDVP